MTHPPGTIAVPVDFSEGARAGLVFSAGLARRFGAALHVVHVDMAVSAFTEALLSSGLTGEVEAVTQRHLDAVRRKLASFVAETPGSAPVASLEVVDSVFVAEAILGFAARVGADWICIGATGRREIEDLVLGSTAAEVVRKAELPVLTMRVRPSAAPEDLHEIREVLVATDLHEGSRRLVATGAMLAGEAGGLTLMHAIEATAIESAYGVPLAIPAEDMRAAVEWTEVALQRFLQGVPDRLVRPVRVRGGRAAEAILACEQELHPDLTIIGTHGRHGLERLTLGSVAERVVRLATGPVLVVPTG